jgi:hypothetical protein
MPSKTAAKPPGRTLTGRRASLHRAVLTGAVVAMAITWSGCGGSTSTTTTTSPTTTLTYSTDILTGTVNTPVNGVLQSDFTTFTVNASGGSVGIALTSAIETLPGGTLLVSVTMGVGVGTVVDGACSVASGSFVTAQPSNAVILGGTSITAGTYCVRVSDATNQLGPVAYAIAVTHA